MEETIDWDAVELNIEETSCLDEELPVDFLRPTATIHNMNSASTDYLCYLCAESFVEKIDLLKHMLDKHKGAHCRCRFCPARFTSIIALTEHLFLSHSQRRKYVCRWCVDNPWSSPSPYMSILHSVIRHKVSLPGDLDGEHSAQYRLIKGMLVCHFCQAGFGIMDNLFLHLMKIHLIEFDLVLTVVVQFKMLRPRSVLMCNYCPKTMDSQEICAFHDRNSCKHFLENYHHFTKYCKGCRNGESYFTPPKPLVKLPARIIVVQSPEPTNRLVREEPEYKRMKRGRPSKLRNVPQPVARQRVSSSSGSSIDKPLQEMQEQLHHYCVDLRCPFVKSKSKYDPVFHHGSLVGVKLTADFSSDFGCHEHSFSLPFLCTVCVGTFLSFHAVVLHFRDYHGNRLLEENESPTTPKLKGKGDKSPVTMPESSQIESESPVAPDKQGNDSSSGSNKKTLEK